MRANLSKSFARTHGHTVVLSKHQVDGLPIAGLAAEERLHGFVGRLLGPVALQGGDNLHGGITLQGSSETIVALNGRRRAFQPHHFHHAPLASQPLGSILAHQTAHFIVVGTYMGGIFL